MERAAPLSVGRHNPPPCQRHRFTPYRTPLPRAKCHPSLCSPRASVIPVFSREDPELFNKADVLCQLSGRHKTPHTQLPLLHHAPTSNLRASARRRWLCSGRAAAAGPRSPPTLPNERRAFGCCRVGQAGAQRGEGSGGLCPVAPGYAR